MDTIRGAIAKGTEEGVRKGLEQSDIFKEVKRLRALVHEQHNSLQDAIVVTHTLRATVEDLTRALEEICDFFDEDTDKGLRLYQTARAALAKAKGGE